MQSIPCYKSFGALCPCRLERPKGLHSYWYSCFFPPYICRLSSVTL